MIPTFQQRIARAVAAIVAATALAALYLAAVRITGTMPQCIFKLITGWECPGCGSQRAFQALLHGNLREAVEVNIMLPLGIAYLALLGICYLFAHKPHLRAIYNHITSPRALIFIATVTVVWTIIRNILGI